jgi:hypothetical protein
VGGGLRKTSSAFRANHQGEIAGPGTPCFLFSISHFIPKSTAWQEKKAAGFQPGGLSILVQPSKE